MLFLKVVFLFLFSYTLINQGWVTQIASQIEVNKPFSRSAYSPSNNDLLDSEEVQQLPSTRAQAHTYMKGILDHL